MEKKIIGFVMKVYYKRTTFRFFLFFGILNTAGATVMLGLNSPKISSIWFLISGLFSLVLYLFLYRRPYLTLKNGRLTKHSFFPESLDLHGLQQVKRFAGDITLISGRQELVINTDYLGKKSLDALELELSKFQHVANGIAI